MARRKAKRNIESLKREPHRDDHLVPLEQLCARLGVDPAVGLSQAEANARLERDGPNRLTPVKRAPGLVIFLQQLVKGFSLMLWAATALCLLAYGISILQQDRRMEYLYLGVVLAGVELVSAAFSFMQEQKSSKVMESFMKMVPLQTIVRRDGEEFIIDTKMLCVGDVVKVRAGDRIPADIRVIEVSGFKVDNSPLTGESVPQALTLTTTSESLLEATNIAFYSTNAVEGMAVGVVLKTGDATMMGQIAALATVITPQKTPLAKEIDHFISIITVVSVVQGVALLIMAMVMGYAWLDAFVFLVGIFVANIPEGLLVTVAVCLSLAAKRMALENCLIKNLEAVETLGSISVICTDKTGTLTQNRMTVAHLWVDMQVETVDFSDIYTAPVIEDLPKSVRVLARTATLCTNAVFKDGDEVPVMRRGVIGDGSEAALIKWVEMAFGTLDEIRGSYEKVCEVAFTSFNRYHLCIYRVANRKNAHFLLVMKGAPEVIFEACTTVLLHGEEKRINDHFRDAFETTHETLGGFGERVLGFCDYYLPSKHFPSTYVFRAEDMNFPTRGFRFIGLTSLIDPPRPNVPAAITQCRAAGIQIVMVTGDHPITAKAIARKVGIISPDSETVEDIARRLNIPIAKVDPKLATAVVLCGSDLARMTPEDLAKVLLVHREIVFARTSPQQKLLVVEGFQKLGTIVAVTGDGVNDAPALKQADIGVAMGISGTEVAKEAADLVLIDDNFSSIVRGVEEGRIIFDNLKKSILYTLTSKVAELAPFLFFVMARAPLPLGTVTILCIDLGTDLLPAISLAYEEAESDIMKQEPRDPVKDKLVNSRLLSMAYGQLGVIQALAGFFAYFVVMAENGFLPDKLLGSHKRWYSKTVNDMEDSYGQEWSYHDRQALEYTCHSAFFVSIVVLQWATLIVSKTRRNSLLRQGMSAGRLPRLHPGHGQGSAHLSPEASVVVYQSSVPAADPGVRHGDHLPHPTLPWWLGGT
ncbi:sodium/potassium-transporting ATPase subunit alpha-like isoform X2 [Eriocheir sinensis]|uniref:sodium/potassium-transporting ATPase subunit alpha-like isoform X2 n=1 Tax=Eriocheir sinensis TaxID=95602 RepID=UPI0021C9FA20|nr:sodium/potassium-transporting ATPase subunit alpha-like isoform X2 [Eriocheir sinensis]